MFLDNAGMVHLAAFGSEAFACVGVSVVMMDFLIIYLFVDAGVQQVADFLGLHRETVYVDFVGVAFQSCL